MPVDVTVVVPVYNPGPFIETCIDGFLSQTMSSGRREIIFVDDGCTDDTPARLDRLAAEHDNVAVIHQPNSGWPGKPRNTGIDAAHGDYVFFCDQDDRLGDEALQRMVATARRTGADVLVPKMVGHARRVPRALFRNTIDRAVLGRDDLMASLTPHKLMRRDFLNDHQLRFPEGKRRLEDHVFVVEAYLLADVISVLSDYPCYHRMLRHDGGNAAYQEVDPAYYFGFVAEVIDIIDAHTEPGELRNALLTRPYVMEMMRKLTGERLLRTNFKLRRQIFNEARTLAVNRFPSDFHERLPIALRAQGTAMLANQLDRMIDVADRTASAVSRAVLCELSRTDTGWRAEIDAELRRDDGSPIRLIPTGDRWSLDPRLIPTDVSAGTYDLNEIERGIVDVVLRHPVDDVVWSAPTSVRHELVRIDGDAENAHRLVLHVTAEIDPATLGGGAPLSRGRWDLRLRTEVFGIGRTVGLQQRPGISAALPPGEPIVAALAPRLRITPGLIKNSDRVALKVTGPRSAPTETAAHRSKARNQPSPQAGKPQPKWLRKLSRRSRRVARRRLRQLQRTWRRISRGVRRS